MLLVDDHEAFRSAARAELEDSGFDVVAELGEARDVVAVATALRPDVVLLDIRLTDGDGVVVADDLATAVPHVAVVLTSSLPSADVRERLAAAASSAAFLPKQDLSGRSLLAVLGR